MLCYKARRKRLEHERSVGRNTRRNSIDVSIASMIGQQRWMKEKDKLELETIKQMS